jgi:uncharacterized protein YndB with AHSA1/START domain
MLKTAAIVFVVLVAALLAFAATRPDSFRIQRTVSVNAPPEKVFEAIDDFHKWGSWSPWEKLDPAMKRTHGGSARGKGAVYEWDGNDKVGAGRMEIVESSPATKIAIKLDFARPMEGHNVAEFTLEPKGSGTSVTWAMYGPSPYLTKLMTVFVSMDSMVGKDFETGLANLKAVAEK